MGRDNRKSEIRRRQTRSKKLKKLRTRYQKAKTDTERKRVLAKAQRVSPWLSDEEFAKNASAA